MTSICWHCGGALRQDKYGEVFATVVVAGERHAVHPVCAVELESAPEVVAPHIFPEGPNFRRYSE